jgi:hypothetical protein
MHTVGPGHPQVARKLAGYSERISALVGRAKELHDEVEVYVFGDHGMAAVEHAHDLWSELRSLDLRVPQEGLYFLDSTMARFWFREDGPRRRVRQLLSGLPYGRILDTRELEQLGAFFPGQDYGELIFLLEEGHILVPSFMGLTAVRGMHGYHPSARASYTTLVTNRTEGPYPRTLRELHALLADAFRRAAA